MGKPANSLLNPVLHDGHSQNWRKASLAWRLKTFQVRREFAASGSLWGIPNLYPLFDDRGVAPMQWT
jgi:hypothetical protein